MEAPSVRFIKLDENCQWISITGTRGLEISATLSDQIGRMVSAKYLELAIYLQEHELDNHFDKD